MYIVCSSPWSTSLIYNHWARFSLRAGDQWILLATWHEFCRLLWLRTWVKCNEWHERLFLPKLYFIYLSLSSLVSVYVQNGVKNCPRMQKCISEVQVLRIFQEGHTPVHPHPHPTVMPLAQVASSPPSPEVKLQPTHILIENPDWGHGTCTSKEQMYPYSEWIHLFLDLGRSMIQIILDHWSWTVSPQRNACMVL